MYDAFDSFIRVGTWQTRQPSDEERFHLDPDQMGPEVAGSYFAQTIDRYCDDAWAVKNFLRYNNVQRS